MSFRELSFAPDRRSVNDSFYRFSAGPSRFSDRLGLSGQDPRYISFEKEYKEKYNGYDLSETTRRNLIDILLNRINIGQYNISFLAAANLGVYLMRINQLTWTPENFQTIFNHLAPVLVHSMQDKTPEEANLSLAKHQAAFFRYMSYIRDQTMDLEAAQPTGLEIEVIEAPSSPESAPSSPETMVVRRRPVRSVPSTVPVTPVPITEEVTVTLTETPSLFPEGEVVSYPSTETPAIEPTLTEPTVISFGQIEEMLSSGQFVEYNLVPEYQYLTNEPNQMMMFVDKQGQTYLSAVQYDDQTGQIYPPL